jgi:hydrogenase expression/formation protein HypE
MRLEEAAIPIAPAVASGCALLGFDPLHLANEGRLVAVVDAADRQRAEAVLAPGGGAWIGTVAEGPARLLLRTAFGSDRLLLPTSGELLPRIC